MMHQGISGEANRMNGQEQRYALWGGAEPEDRLVAIEYDEELMSAISPLFEPLE